MEYNNLYDLITYLQYGTKLNICVEFFGNYGNEKTILPHIQTIHGSRVCDEFKKTSKGSKKCYKCKKLTYNKALEFKKHFSGLCINGVYEYVRPVVIDNDVACIIYIGNILDMSKGYQILKVKLENNDYLFDTLQKEFSYEQCERLGSLIESYVRVLFNVSAPEKREYFNPLIENIKNYIETNLEYEINLSQLAEIFKYNKQYLGRIFKKETKMSFNEYITKQRIERAKKQLKESNEQIITIALKSGFNSVTYFNNVFKKYMKMTPIQYRKSMR